MSEWLELSGTLALCGWLIVVSIQLRLIGKRLNMDGSRNQRVELILKEYLETSMSEDEFLKRIRRLL